MSAALFYIDNLPEVGDLAVVDGDEGFHAANVRRIRSGEELDLGDGAGAMAHCVIEDVGKARLTARVLKRWTVEPATPTVTVVQALPKSDRSELAIELATEAGADAFVAWQAARCVARWDGGRADKGLRRWRAVARAAARQSRRPHIPSVTGVATTDALLADVREAVSLGATVVALHESATEPLTKLLSRADGFDDAGGRTGGRYHRRRDRRAVCRRGESGAAGADGTEDVDSRGGRTGRGRGIDDTLGLTSAGPTVAGARRRRRRLNIGTGRFAAVNWVFGSNESGKNPESRQKTPRDAQRDQR